jgi:molybdopterin-guanine dinucleotide biosynthesis protein A
MKAPLYGLLLAGGESRRMGTDKALLTYHELPQLLHTFRQLKLLCDKCYISIRQTQADGWFKHGSLLFSEEEIHLSGLDLKQDILIDHVAYLGSGPLSGVLSAMSMHRDVAWLVAGCDYPLFDNDDYKSIVDGRNNAKLATVIIDPYDRKPLPMPAIFEPAIFEEFKSVYLYGDQSMRTILCKGNTEIIPLKNELHLQSIDSPDQMEYILHLKEKKNFNQSNS